MNKNLYLNCFFIFFSISCLSASNIILNPSFQFDYVSTDIDASSDSIGSFNGTILNISSDVITLAVIRRVNDLSEGWTSSICAGVTCYNESVDSISIQINPGDSVSCGILAWTNGSGNGMVQLDIFDLTSSTENILVDIKRGSSKSEVIVDVNVVEKPTGSLTFGAGYSSATGLGGLIEYGEKNFLGRGQALSFAIKTGKDNQLYDMLRSQIDEISNHDSDLNESIRRAIKVLETISD